MTLLTAHAKLAVMDVLILVTTDAITAQWGCILASRCLLLMATRTTDFPMRAVKHIFGLLVVIEVPELPGACVVAGLALHTQGQLVLVFLFVAAITIARRIFKSWRLVTTLAGCHNVPTGQWELGYAMIKLSDEPSTVVVARLADLASLTFVLVVLLVTAITIQRRIAKTQ